MALTTTTQLTTNITGAYDKRLLDRLVPKFIHMGYGETRPVPANSGATLTFRRYGNLTAATTALTEGVTPAGSQLAKTDLTVTVAAYGDYITVTDWLDMTGLDPKIIRPLDILADQAGDTHDQLARNAMLAGTQICYSAASAAASVIDDKLKDGHIAWAVNLLRRTNVDFITEKVTGTSYGGGAGTSAGVTAGNGTQAIDAGYIFIGHVDMDADIRALTGFIATRYYAQPGKVLPGEIGTVGYCRFVLTNNAKVTAATGTTALTTGMRTTLTGGSYADVYYSIMFGKGFYCNSQINGQSTRTIIKSFSAASSNDPLEQRSTIGWKSTYGGAILDDRRGVLFLTAASMAGAVTQTSAGVGVGSGDTTYKAFLT